MDLIWYTAYGSNLHARRLAVYLDGGQPAGASRICPGCRDNQPPRQTMPVLLPGGVYFALESTTWTGGVAFYDDRLPGRVAARAYLVTAAQFADIAAQEMHQPPGADQHAAIAEAVSTGRTRLGPGCYETLVYVGSHDGHPMLTFTAPWTAADIAWNPPAPAYLRMIAAGLHETCGWSPDEIASYLADRPGVNGHWPSADLRELAADAIGLPQRGSSREPASPVDALA